MAGKIKETSGKKKTLYTISGKWDEEIFIKPADTKVPCTAPPPVSVYCLMRSCLTPFYCFANQQKDELLWDPKNAPPKVTMDIRPLDKQDECESRRCVPLPASILTRTRLQPRRCIAHSTVVCALILVFSLSLSL